MLVREAQYTDIKNILDFLESYHKDSNLADIPFDRQSVLKVAEYVMGAKDAIALVAYNDDALVGVLFGTLEPFFFNKKRSYATDILFIGHGAGVPMWRKFKEWAFFHGAERLMMGVSSGDQRAGQLLEALGMNNTGGMYVLRG